MDEQQPEQQPQSQAGQDQPLQQPQLPQQFFGATLFADSHAAPSTEKPYHSKRPHKKSRTGCRNCKVRKVKCDEGRPTCRSCKLRKVECVYPTPASSSTSASPATSVTNAAETPATTVVRGSSPEGFSSPASSFRSRQHTPAFSDAAPTGQPLWNPANIDAADMKLLWFYTATTSSSFSVAGPGTPVEEILKVRMVQVAFETPFLMDSLFALSSLHMQSLNQDCDPSRALAYRARSFEGYRTAVESAAPENYAALIANSLFLTALSSQVFREPDGKELYILDWMVVWRGIGLVIDLMGVDNLFHTGMYALFQRPPIDLMAALADIPNHLLFMVSSIKSDDQDYEDIATYHETLKYLASLYMNLRDGFNPVMSLRIVTFFTFLPRRFVELGRQRRPRALVIIAYYAVFLKLTTSIWWLEGVGQRSLLDLCKFLSPEWDHLLHVPKAAMEAEDELEIARVIFQDPNWVPPPPPDLQIDPSSAITVVDDTGRRLTWASKDKKIVVLNSKKPSEPPLWH
ncbi:hypothetical protein B0T10DRAFT_413376 [Thelonectria olida]|uniref:Zn(2)-C6 fungal-type domain-containing protein n=1 Tax=Thelonectria olida TaxID=1576542 RepID=A0A9P8VUR3_9HYPO|nr:hypothetical protein B0T10DRAFT_413376 [Thelonectria olida]